MTTAPAPSRIVSLDQFRGYTVAGMLLVNFVGSYSALIALAPTLKHYNTHCSYADTIMPQFFFAVGFAYRLTYLRRRQTLGTARASWQAVKRCLGLILVGAIIYHLDGGAKTWEELTRKGWSGFFSEAFERRVFQTLVHIGLTSLWVLPVIGATRWVQIGFLLFSVLLHISVSHPNIYPQTWGRFLGDWLGWERSYYEWVMTRPGIDGGPLGFLTWTVPLLLGSLAYDAMSARAERPPIGRFIFWSMVLMLMGYALSCMSTVDPTPGVQWRHQFSEKGPRFDSVVRVSNGMATQSGSGEAQCRLVEPPFVPPTGVVNVWTMSQRAGSPSYLIFATGFALAVYVLFILACYLGPVRIGLFRTFGQNALAAYIIHFLVDRAVTPWVPYDSPWWFALIGFGIFFGISYLLTRYLEKNGIFLRL
jgi:predicted acyltransferase